MIVIKERKFSIEKWAFFTDAHVRTYASVGVNLRFFSMIFLTMALLGRRLDSAPLGPLFYMNLSKSTLPLLNLPRRLLVFALAAVFASPIVLRN